MPDDKTAATQDRKLIGSKEEPCGLALASTAGSGRTVGYIARRVKGVDRGARPGLSSKRV